MCLRHIRLRSPISRPGSEGPRPGQRRVPRVGGPPITYIRRQSRYHISVRPRWDTYPSWQCAPRGRRMLGAQPPGGASIKAEASRPPTLRCPSWLSLIGDDSEDPLSVMMGVVSRPSLAGVPEDDQAHVPDCPYKAAIAQGGCTVSLGASS